jgi:hypothetical protein
MLDMNLPSQWTMKKIWDSRAPLKNRKFEFRSNMISHACGNIDKAMRKLHRRVAKEPYFWVMASCKENN